MSYTPLEIANFFIERANNGKDPSGVSHLKLQKLVYCAHGWWLAYAEDDPPLVSESPQAWKLGPLFKSLYRALEGYGMGKIGHAITPTPFFNEEDAAAGPESDKRTKALLNWVWDRYEGVGAYTLSMMTNQPSTPWYEISQKHKGDIPEGTEIPLESIRKEFMALKGSYV